MHPTSCPTHIPFIPCESTLLSLLRYCNFNILPWQYKAKVMGEVQVENNNMVLTFYRITSHSFHVNRPFYSWDKNFWQFDLKNPMSRSWIGWTMKVTTSGAQHSIDSHLFRSMSIGYLEWKKSLKRLQRYVPQVWQPPAQPPGPWRQYPSSLRDDNTPQAQLCVFVYILNHQINTKTLKHGFHTTTTCITPGNYSEIDFW